MTPARATVGRNNACPCGSGRKYKHCCESKKQRMSVTARVALVAAGGLLIAGLAFGIASYRSDTAAGTTGVWSPEHGHYH
jgi:hypothetical protein